MISHAAMARHPGIAMGRRESEPAGIEKVTAAMSTITADDGDTKSTNAEKKHDSETAPVMAAVQRPTHLSNNPVDTLYNPAREWSVEQLHLGNAHNTSSPLQMDRRLKSELKEEMENTQRKLESEPGGKWLTEAEKESSTFGCLQRNLHNWTLYKLCFQNRRFADRRRWS